MSSPESYGSDCSSSFSDSASSSSDSSDGSSSSSDSLSSSYNSHYSERDSERVRMVPIIDHDVHDHQHGEHHPVDSSSSDDGDFGESSTVEPPAKRLKTFDIAKDDRISTLPDPVLLHILSFRNMREVIRTCKISRRWRSLWKSVPSLIFHFSKNKRYIRDRNLRFVDRVLLHRNEDANIDKLSFSCPNIYYPDLQSWMSAAQRRDVQELYLDFTSDYIAELPSFIFTSGIKVFKLHSARCTVPLPRSIRSATQLHTIELHNASLINGMNMSRNKIAISCPVLEELKMINCDHRTIMTLRVSAPQLKMLVLDNQDSSKRPSYCKIEIFAQNLTSLVLRGFMYKDYILRELSSLVHAEFELDKHPAHAQILDNVLHGLYNVTNLSLKLCPQRSQTSPQMLDWYPNSFVNLRRLRLIGSTDGFSVRPVHLLRKTPCLETLVLEMNQVRSMGKDFVDMLQCLDGLKYFEIKGIEYSDDELAFCKYVLENASVLEIFTMTKHERFSLKTLEEKAEFNTKIYSLRRASSKVAIYFS